MRQILNTISQQGFLPTLNNAIIQAGLIAQVAPISYQAAVQLGSQGFNPSLRPKEIPGESGGGSYCENTSFAVDALALAFLTIGIMTGVGAIAEGAAWGAITVWGGGSVTVYGTANRWLCH